MKRTLVTVNGIKTDTISIFDHGLLYGDGIFETFRVFNGKPFFMNDHINRLYKSAKGMGLHIPYSRSRLMRELKSMYERFGKKDMFMRILVTRGKAPEGIIARSRPNIIMICSARKFKPLGKAKATISRIRKFSHDAASRSIKSISYGATAEALYKARKEKFDEVIFLNEHDDVMEASTSNIFLVKRGVLFTPSRESGLLEGIIRKIIIKKFPVVEKTLTTKELLSADEVFLTGTANFITSVKLIDGVRYQNFNYSKTVFDKLYSLILKEDKF